MTLVAWILALVGAGLASMMLVGTGTGVMRPLDRTSGLAFLPLPGLAMYFTGPELYALIKAGEPVRGLMFVAGPFLIGLGTVLAVIWAARRGHGP